MAVLTSKYPLLHGHDLDEPDVKSVLKLAPEHVKQDVGSNPEHVAHE
jgi:hypothetical protein